MTLLRKVWIMAHHTMYLWSCIIFCNQFYKISTSYQIEQCIMWGLSMITPLWYTLHVSCLFCRPWTWQLFFHCPLAPWCKLLLQDDKAVLRHYGYIFQYLPRCVNNMAVQWPETIKVEFLEQCPTLVDNTTDILVGLYGHVTDLLREQTAKVLRQPTDILDRTWRQQPTSIITQCPSASPLRQSLSQWATTPAHR